ISNPRPTSCASAPGASACPIVPAGFVASPRPGRGCANRQTANHSHDRPSSLRHKPGAVLALVKAAARRLRRWPAASPDERCARRPLQPRPGRRNGLLRPNKETNWRQSARSRMSTISSVAPSTNSKLAERPPHPDLLPLKGEKERRRCASVKKNKSLAEDSLRVLKFVVACLALV